MIELGEIRKYMGSDVVIMLEKLTNRNASYDKPYWVIIHSSWDDAPKPPMFLPPAMHKNFGSHIRTHDTGLRVAPQNVCRTNLLAIPIKPTHPVMDTMCCQIDNRLGRLKWLWSLPLDKPRPGFVEQQYGSENEKVFESAKKSGAVIYG